MVRDFYMNNLDIILDRVYNVLAKKLCFFKTEYINSLKIFQTFQHYKKNGRIPLAISSSFIFALILEEEDRTLESEILFDLMLLLSCLFYSYGLYDAIHDHKKTEVLSCANVLFKEALLLSTKYGLEISEAVNVMEQYNRNPIKLKTGKIKMKHADELDLGWCGIKQGFYIAVTIVDQFIDQFIPGVKKNWPRFYENYLIYNQIMDDITDFTEDYKNGELKSFGIFALLKRFRHKKKIDLSKAIVSFQFELFVLKNAKVLHTQFLERFNEYVSLYEPIEEFKNSVRKLKNLNRILKGEVIL